MKTFYCVLAFLAGLLTATCGAVVDFTFSYDRIQLKSGRKIEKVTLKTYDTATGRVGAVSGRNLFSVQLTDLPEEVAVRIRKEAPQLTEDELRAERLKAVEIANESKVRAKEIEKRAAADNQADRDAQRRLNVKKAEVTIDRESRTSADLAVAAKEMARHYFTYEADPHSSVGFVFTSSVQLEDPEPVPGWDNRWRVRGKVGVQYLTRDGGAVGRNTKEFEMLIDAPAKGRPKLVDITISRM